MLDLWVLCSKPLFEGFQPSKWVSAALGPVERAARSTYLDFFHFDFHLISPLDLSSVRPARHSFHHDFQKNELVLGFL